MIGTFILSILFVLTSASDRVALHRKDMFSILVLSTKEQYTSFLKKVFGFQEICFKVKIKTQENTKIWWFLKQRAILKIPSTVFLEEPNLLPLNWNLWKKAFSCVFLVYKKFRTLNYICVISKSLLQINSSCFSNMVLGNGRNKIRISV